MNDDEFREQIVSLTGYGPGSRTVQAFMEVVAAAEARGRAEEREPFEAVLRTWETGGDVTRMWLAKEFRESMHTADEAQ